MRDGLPLSWRHYVYGLAQIQRAAARETLRFAIAVRAGQSTTDEFTRWRRGMIEETY